MQDSPTDIAQRDWHTKARVRILETMSVSSVDPPGVRHFVAGEECVMLQWGRRGFPVDRTAWWDSRDIDGAYIIPAEHVEVIEILEEVLPV